MSDKPVSRKPGHYNTPIRFAYAAAGSRYSRSTDMESAISNGLGETIERSTMEVWIELTRRLSPRVFTISLTE